MSGELMQLKKRTGFCFSEPISVIVSTRITSLIHCFICCSRKCFISHIDFSELLGSHFILRKLDRFYVVFKHNSIRLLFLKKTFSLLLIESTTKAIHHFFFLFGQRNLKILSLDNKITDTRVMLYKIEQKLLKNLFQRGSVYLAFIKPYVRSLFMILPRARSISWTK